MLQLWALSITLVCEGAAFCVWTALESPVRSGERRARRHRLTLGAVLWVNLISHSLFWWITAPLDLASGGVAIAEAVVILSEGLVYWRLSERTLFGVLSLSAVLNIASWAAGDLVLPYI